MSDSGTPELNVVGAGKAGRAVARLWHEGGLVRIRQVCNRTRESALEAIAFLGTGEACDGLDELAPAQSWLLGCGDDDLPGLVQALDRVGVVPADALVVHLSGARPAADLVGLGAETASFHPVCSFADPAVAFAGFAGTLVGIEGTAAACERLESWAGATGARPFRIAGAHKALYHAASASAANHLVTLIDLADGLYRLAGIEPEIARELSLSLAGGALDNVARIGAESALTGPVSRGDVSTVAAHLAALPDALQASYRALALETVSLALRSGRLGEAAARRLRRLLADDSLQA